MSIECDSFFEIQRNVSFGRLHVSVFNQLIIYISGMVGDWKNHFTVAENERMDKWLAKNLVKTDLKFRYTL